MEHLSPSDTGENKGSYTVQKGDTLSKIAQEKKIPLRDLIAAQGPNFDPNKLRIGQVLNMPKKSIDVTQIERGNQDAQRINIIATEEEGHGKAMAQADMKAALDAAFGGASERSANNAGTPVGSDTKGWEYLIKAGEKFDEIRAKALENRGFTKAIIHSIQQAGYTIDTSAIDALDIRSGTDAISKTPFYIRGDRSGHIDVSYAITQKLTHIENDGTQLLLTFEGDSSPKITLPIKSKS